VGKPSEKPVFLDEKGKRWRYTRVVLCIVFAGSVLGLSALIPITHARVQVPKLQGGQTTGADDMPPELQSPAQIAYGLDHSKLPIIGEGPLIRVIRVIDQTTTPVGRAAVDVYSGEVVGHLTSAEADEVGGQKYALQQYGKTHGKRIALTFDDGPDPAYTPQILDLLSRESAPSTFFAVGAAIAKFPDIAERSVREGHLVANHTFSHVDFDFADHKNAIQEINFTQRIIRTTTHRNPPFFRLPYGGSDSNSLKDNVRGILQAQQLGYIVVSFNIDSNDWGFATGQKPEMFEFDGADHVVLLHDGGGDRSQTVTYLSMLIKNAKAAGYTFTTLEHLYPIEPPAASYVTPSFADKTTFTIAQMLLVLPRRIIHGLFVTTVAFVFIALGVNLILSMLQLRFHKPKRRRRGYLPFVSVIIPAYNEERVLAKSVRSILRSRYRNFEVIVVDDGSQDKTWEIAQKLLHRSRRVRIIHQKNRGKAVAVNRGIKASRGEIIVSIDADTVFLPATLGRLAKHFYNPEVGAVAGTVKVGNIGNVITRWQALEYIISINLERTAQAYLRAIMIVPGACSAWRKEAVLAAGGYSSSTLAEDCDLTLAVRKAGYEITQDIEAIAYTESPQNLNGLAKQRFRWTFGNLQAIWKHRDLLFRREQGWLGAFILPKAVLGILLQVLFAPILLFISLGNMAAGQLLVILLYIAVAHIVLIATALIGLMLARERVSHLLATPLYRVIYSPLRTFLLYFSLLVALQGSPVGWAKVARRGTVKDTPSV